MGTIISFWLHLPLSESFSYFNPSVPNWLHEVHGLSLGLGSEMQVLETLDLMNISLSTLHGK